jgi:excisionase family DNA binding protein
MELATTRVPLTIQPRADWRLPADIRGAQAQPKLLYTPEEAAQLLSMSRTRIYALLGRNAIFSIKEGRARLVPAIALEEYVQRRLAEHSPHDWTNRSAQLQARQHSGREGYLGTTWTR